MLLLSETVAPGNVTTSAEAALPTASASPALPPMYPTYDEPFGAVAPEPPEPVDPPVPPRPATATKTCVNTLPAPTRLTVEFSPSPPFPPSFVPVLPAPAVPPPPTWTDTRAALAKTLNGTSTIATPAPAPPPPPVAMVEVVTRRAPAPPPPPPTSVIRTHWYAASDGRTQNVSVLAVEFSQTFTCVAGDGVKL